jgi:hypothetical protein
MLNGKHLATSQRVAKAWHARDPEQLPRPARQPVVEDALEASMQIGIKRGLGCRLVIGEDP